MSARRTMAACGAAAALLVARGARGEPPPDPKPAAEQAPAAAAATPSTAPPAARAAPRPVTWSEPERARVSPGILVRAAKRAQQREGAACSPCTARPDAAQGEIESVEIDWHAATAAP